MGEGEALKDWVNRERWLRGYAEYIKKQFSEYETQINEKYEDFIDLTIFNPNIPGRDIVVNFDSMRATVHFSYQHAHLEYDDGMDNIVEYIKSYISGRCAAVEFFKDSKNAMGGGYPSDAIDFSSVESILTRISPELSERQIERFAETIVLAMPHLTKEEVVKDIVKNRPRERARYLEDFKHHDYRVCAVFWDGKRDKYVQIVWDGSELSVKQITSADVLPPG